MKTQVLDELDIVSNQQDRTAWITKISQQDLYKLASWLMNHLIEQTQERQHKRSQIRSVLDWYYQHHFEQGIQEPWTNKQKWFIAHSVIDLWPERQIEEDPRYKF